MRSCHLQHACSEVHSAYSLNFSATSDFARDLTEFHFQNTDCGLCPESELESAPSLNPTRMEIARFAELVSHLLGFKIAEDGFSPHFAKALEWCSGC